MVFNGGDASVQSYEVFGGFDDNPEDSIRQVNPTKIGFSSLTSGDIDGAHFHFKGVEPPSTIVITGTLHDDVKVGVPLAGNSHKAQPTHELMATWEQLARPGRRSSSIAGGAELFVWTVSIPDVTLPVKVQRTASFDTAQRGGKAMYFVEGHGVATK